ncbi:hypothetical protein BpHYR1_013773 [Brachionus plicatilis]|uniref:Uncharacterized protein n=1 Tax=Brachionus plicatilis TaxID=10195 RepID=A0A3M7RAW8_BRAPC|nr:hypothetical protein BpHYR1_013773 [Brachionus plicatilis]
MKLKDENKSYDKNEKSQAEKASFKSEIQNFEKSYFSRSNNNLFKKIASALFYALASMMIMFSNKIY